MQINIPHLYFIISEELQEFLVTTGFIENNLVPLLGLLRTNETVQNFGLCVLKDVGKLHLFILSISQNLIPFTWSYVFFCKLLPGLDQRNVLCFEIILIMKRNCTLYFYISNGLVVRDAKLKYCIGMMVLAYNFRTLSV